MKTIVDVKRANDALGHYWFSAASMRFFDSRLHGTFAPLPEPRDGVVGYFVHSRQFHGSDGTSGPRTYHVAAVGPNGEVNPGGVNPSPFPDGYPDLPTAQAVVVALVVAVNAE